MRVIVQRVKQASVTVDGNITGQIRIDLLVLAGFEEADQAGDLEWMAQKLVKLRIFLQDAYLPRLRSFSRPSMRYFSRQSLPPAGVTRTNRPPPSAIL